MLHRFWLIRHALVHADSLSRLYGTDDVPVCDVTMAADAPRYAALAARLPRPARLVCTPLKRTQVTAAALMRAGYPAQTPLLDAAFVEQNFGALQGTPIAHFDMRPAGRHPFWPIHAEEMPPGGECFDDMVRRVGAGLERLRDNAEGRDTIIVSHGGAIRAAVAHTLGLSAHQALCLSVENISLTRIEHHKSGWRVMSVNEHFATQACEASAAPSTARAHNDMKQTQGATS
ncbi:histidine phosphatase family protein [Acidocella sp.]|uniref:histidine phosphatase family protein n=1 Tax=Acidocella sp. TaxID=50710 RepID=UPI002F3F52C8